MSEKQEEPSSFTPSVTAASSQESKVFRFFLTAVKGALCSFEEGGHPSLLERWQGPPHMNTVKQYKLCCPLSSVCLFRLFPSRKQKEFNYCLFRQKIVLFFPETTDCSFNSPPCRSVGTVSWTSDLLPPPALPLTLLFLYIYIRKIFFT